MRGVDGKSWPSKVDNDRINQDRIIESNRQTKVVCVDVVWCVEQSTANKHEQGTNVRETASESETGSGILAEFPGRKRDVCPYVQCWRANMRIGRRVFRRRKTADEASRKRDREEVFGSSGDSGKRQESRSRKHQGWWKRQGREEEKTKGGCSGGGWLYQRCALFVEWRVQSMGRCRKGTG